MQREFFPPEMSNERCAMYNANEIPRPIKVLEATLSNTAAERAKIGVGGAVLHWFKRDLRLCDNKALSLAAAKAKEKDVPLICVFSVSPQDYQAHLTSATRVDFEMRTLKIMREELAALDVPLCVETVDKRKEVPSRLINLAES